jgi:hypothetical protein
MLLALLLLALRGGTHRRVAYVSRDVRKAAYIALGVHKYEKFPSYTRKLLSQSA